MTAAVPFDGVFKMGGVLATAGTEVEKTSCWIRVSETGRGVRVLIPDYYVPLMTVAEARSLAAQILECARRHEVRQALKP